MPKRGSVPIGNEAGRPTTPRVSRLANSRSRCHAGVETRVHAAAGLKATVRVAPASANLHGTGLLRRMVCCCTPGASSPGVFGGGSVCGRLPLFDRSGSRVACGPCHRSSLQRRRNRWMPARDRHKFPRVEPAGDAREIVPLKAVRTPEQRSATTRAGDRADRQAEPSVTRCDDELWRSTAAPRR